MKLLMSKVSAYIYSKGWELFDHESFRAWGKPTEPPGGTMIYRRQNEYLHVSYIDEQPHVLEPAALLAQLAKIEGRSEHEVAEDIQAASASSSG